MPTRLEAIAELLISGLEPSDYEETPLTAKEILIKARKTFLSGRIEDARPATAICTIPMGDTWREACIALANTAKDITGSANVNEAGNTIERALNLFDRAIERCNT